MRVWGIRELTNKSWVSVLIPTYKRADLLDHVFYGLRNQSFENFEVVVILKPSGDGTEKVVDRYKKFLNIKLIIQEKGYFIEALSLGLEKAAGDVIAFLDDDAIPFPNWIQEHVKTYEKPNVGGVAGNVIPAILKKNKPIHTNNYDSEIIPNYKPFLETVAQKIWRRPLKGLEDYLVYISKAGVVEKNTRIAYYARRQTVKSLLGMGANMSVLAKAVKGFKLPQNSWILGLANEQFLGWYIWKQGYHLLFNPNAKVYHLSHGQTLTRNVKDVKKHILRQVESQLLFYRLYDLEPNLSKMHRITWLIFSALLNIKQIPKEQNISGLRSMFIGNITGLKWLLFKKLGLNYDLLNDLKAIGV
jgi:glycosyltransferase involved in cell wall biosynthesis